MRHTEFFQGIKHVQIPWGERSIWAPLFFYDVSTLAAHFLAPLDKVRAMLPSERMHPLRVTPGQCIVSIAAFEYRDCDIGPYNEVSVAVPVMLDKPSPLFTGILRKPPEEPRLYVRHLPVTTEIARDAGIEFAAYPKSLADIQFEREDGWVRCHWRDGERHVLTLAGREGELRNVPRGRMHAINARDGHLLRVETILSERMEANGRNPSHLQLQLGEHPIADELRAMQLGRLAGYTYAPRHQAVLTPVLESMVA